MPISRRALQFVVPAAVGLGLVLLALPIAMVLYPAPYAASIARSMPDSTSAQVSDLLAQARWATMVIHGLYGLVLIWLAVKAASGWNPARVLLTIAAGLTIIGGGFSALSGPEYHLPVIAAAALHLIIVGLLWVPRSSKARFARHSTPRR